MKLYNFIPLSQKVQQVISKFFPSGNNPTDLYVIAAGDGDGMGKWLKGEHLKNYQNYMDKMPTIPDSADSETEEIYRTFENLKGIQKRMGPSTHNALSRALLDFSNQFLQ